MGFIWVLIPLAGIALAGFSEWLKFKRQTAAIGTTTSALEGVAESLRGDVETLLKEQRALNQRIQNLETIVTSEAWDTLGEDPQLAKAKTPPLQISEFDDENDTEQTARMARRLRQ